MSFLKKTLLFRALSGIHRNFLRPKYAVAKSEFLLLL